MTHESHGMPAPTLDEQMNALLARHSIHDVLLALGGVRGADPNERIVTTSGGYMGVAPGVVLPPILAKLDTEVTTVGAVAAQIHAGVLYTDDALEIDPASALSPGFEQYLVAQMALAAGHWGDGVGCPSSVEMGRWPIASREAAARWAARGEQLDRDTLATADWRLSAPPLVRVFFERVEQPTIDETLAALPAELDLPREVARCWNQDQRLTWPEMNLEALRRRLAGADLACVVGELSTVLSSAPTFTEVNGWVWGDRRAGISWAQQMRAIRPGVMSIPRPPTMLEACCNGTPIQVGEQIGIAPSVPSLIIALANTMRPRPAITTIASWSPQQRLSIYRWAMGRNPGEIPASWLGSEPYPLRRWRREYAGLTMRVYYFGFTGDHGPHAVEVVDALTMTISSQVNEINDERVAPLSTPDRRDVMAWILARPREVGKVDAWRASIPSAVADLLGELPPVFIPTTEETHDALVECVGSAVTIEDVRELRINEREMVARWAVNREIEEDVTWLDTWRARRGLWMGSEELDRRCDALIGEHHTVLAIFGERPTWAEIHGWANADREDVLAWCLARPTEEAALKNWKAKMPRVLEVHYARVAAERIEHPVRVVIDETKAPPEQSGGTIVETDPRPSASLHMPNGDNVLQFFEGPYGFEIQVHGERVHHASAVVGATLDWRRAWEQHINMAPAVADADQRSTPRTLVELDAGPGAQRAPVLTINVTHDDEMILDLYQHEASPIANLGPRYGQIGVLEPGVYQVRVTLRDQSPIRLVPKGPGLEAERDGKILAEICDQISPHAKLGELAADTLTRILAELEQHRWRDLPRVTDALMLTAIAAQSAYEIFADSTAHQSMVAAIEADFSVETVLAHHRAAVVYHRLTVERGLAILALAEPLKTRQNEADTLRRRWSENLIEANAAAAKP